MKLIKENMCGIWACFHNTGDIPYTIGSNALQKRGPDTTIQVNVDSIMMSFSHLRINGNTLQPMTCGKWWILCNGEIFNHKDLEEKLSIVAPPGASDCWILPYLFQEYGVNNACRMIDGEFAIIAYNSELNTLYACRDPFGVRPLFYGKHNDQFFVASEMKALPECGDVRWVNPGKYLSVDSSFLVSETQYFTPVYSKVKDLSPLQATFLLRHTLVNAVKKRCLSDKPVAALLSGGLDSSIICAILAKILPVGSLHTFSIGTEGSPDLKYAKMVANHIGSNHHEVVLKPEDFQNAVEDVIYDIESYDITTVRASVGNWLLGKYIKSHTNFKVIFNGDGSDEVFGGYLYFKRAPSDKAFEAEIDLLLSEIHMYDVLRSDRSMAAHGLEARTPYLDPAFVAIARTLPTHLLRTPLEKGILRDAFAEWLPVEIIQRRKEAFSDGVNAIGKAWFKRDDEAEIYKSVFEKYYISSSIIPHMWMPKWSPETNDPSARTLNTY